MKTWQELLDIDESELETKQDYLYLLNKLRYYIVDTRVDMLEKCPPLLSESYEDELTELYMAKHGLTQSIHDRFDPDDLVIRNY